MRHGRGFTIAEMAIAVAILALLLFAAMVPFSTQVDVRNVADTRRSMDSIREALLGFAQANGRLPCPALGTTATGAAGAGTEQLVGNACTATFGVVPWATLGTPETDAWGRRFSYWVSPIFADAVAANTFNSPGQFPSCTTPTPQPSQSSFALCSLGILTVSTRSEVTHSTVTALGSNLPVVFISHGKNGGGAYLPNGVVVATVGGADEIANSTGNRPYVTTSTFISRPPTRAASGCNDTTIAGFCEFDDLVVMIPASTLIARTVAAGKLP